MALLETASHPQLLAHEAFALFDACEAAARVALVLREPPGPARVLACAGWSYAEAVALARRAGHPHQTIPLGGRRDRAFELIVEPRPDLAAQCEIAAIRKVLDAALALDALTREQKQRASLWPQEEMDDDANQIYASSEMTETLATARKIAPTDIPVLLTGETGTGKEVLARIVHGASARAAQPFVPFNCTAVPREMLDSQLFGYRRGAFTGADASFPGVIRAAAGGTLFLDEIGELGADVQPKLLRFLETHEIHPLGEPQPVAVDVRVIAATNANLDQMVGDGRFREDLFYRLNVIRFRIPPLRERREEIPPLVQHYLARFATELKKGRLQVTEETMEYLLLYAWPGNVRQLANEIRRMAALAEPNTALTPDALSAPIRAARRTVPAAGAPPEPNEVSVRVDVPLDSAVEALERIMVQRALDRAHGKVEEAAKILGISRKGLFLKRRRWGLQHRRAAS